MDKPKPNGVLTPVRFDPPNAPKSIACRVNVVAEDEDGKEWYFPAACLSFDMRPVLTPKEFEFWHSSNEWVLDHYLDTMDVRLDVFIRDIRQDNDESQVIPSDVEVVDKNRVIIKFNFARRGRVVLTPNNPYG